MGGCFSSEAGVLCRAPSSRLPASPGPVDRIVWSPVISPEISAVASACGWAEAPAAAASCTARATAGAVCVRCSPSSMLLALFEGVGPERGAAAVVDWARQAVGPAFDECLAQRSGNVPAALGATFARLDRQLAASDAVSHAAKSSSGAVGSLLHLDLLQRTAHVANLGHAGVAVCLSRGAFNSRESEGCLLTARHTIDSAEERVRKARRLGGICVSPMQQLEQQAAEAATAGVAVTRALGLLDAKRRQESGADLISAEADVCSHSLGSCAQHLLLATGSVWTELAPSDAALRLYCCEKASRRGATADCRFLHVHLVWPLMLVDPLSFALIRPSQLIQSEVARTAAAAAACQPPTPTPGLANMAEHLMLYCTAKKTSRLSRQAAAAELTPGPHEDEGQPIGATAESALPMPAPHAAPAYAAVVVSLHRQAQSMDSAACNSSAVALQQQQSSGSGASGSYLQRLAARRWALLRMEVEFQRLRRRALLHKWCACHGRQHRQGA